MMNPAHVNHHRVNTAVECLKLVEMAATLRLFRCQRPGMISVVQLFLFCWYCIEVV